MVNFKSNYKLIVKNARKMSVFEIIDEFLRKLINELKRIETVMKNEF